MTAPTKGRLIGHFEDRTRDTHNEGWASLWDTKQEDLWDRGKPSPALIDFIEQKPEYLPMTKTGKRLKALIPACGRGYDVIMLALHGFDVYGLEINQTAVSACAEYARSQLHDPNANNFGEDQRTKYAEEEIGNVRYVVGDFFTKDWESKFGLSGDVKFDLIYDYTFLCAIMPEMRLDWARRMKQLLAADGILICLEFPLYKDPEAAGPPYGLVGVYDNLLAEGKSGGFGTDGLHTHKAAHVDKEEKLELVIRYQPERTYKVGEGTDMLSVWRHKTGFQKEH